MKTKKDFFWNLFWGQFEVLLGRRVFYVDYCSDVLFVCFFFLFYHLICCCRFYCCM
uniref:Putative C-rich region 3 n=1 Tax=Trypanosoma lewisi TaxID=5695 RepID=A0A7G4WFE9_TRYLE|nr:putative C-rich region 3 [Trypanosoma lewisi]